MFTLIEFCLDESKALRTHLPSESKAVYDHSFTYRTDSCEGTIIEREQRVEKAANVSDEYLVFTSLQDIWVILHFSPVDQNTPDCLM